MTWVCELIVLSLLINKTCFKLSWHGSEFIGCVIVCHRNFHHNAPNIYIYNIFYYMKANSAPRPLFFDRCSMWLNIVLLKKRWKLSGWEQMLLYILFSFWDYISLKCFSYLQQFMRTMLLPPSSKWAYIFHKIVNCPAFNILMCSIIVYKCVSIIFAFCFNLRLCTFCVCFLELGVCIHIERKHFYEIPSILSIITCLDMSA